MSRQAIPAAPPPVETTLISSKSLPATRSALVAAAPTTMAVPCWSSWKTGMFMRSRQMRSTTKQSGALMSSRLIAPKVGSSAQTMSASFSGSLSSSSMSKQSMLANFLNSTALPSITGLDASAPMLPSPSTAVPFETTRDEVAAGGVVARGGGVGADLEAGLGDAGRIGAGEVAAVGQRLGGADLELSGPRKLVIVQRRLPQRLVPLVVHPCLFGGAGRGRRRCPALCAEKREKGNDPPGDRPGGGIEPPPCRARALRVRATRAARRAGAGCCGGERGGAAGGALTFALFIPFASTKLIGHLANPAPRPRLACDHSRRTGWITSGRGAAADDALGEDIAFFTGTLGMRMERIFPADDPRWRYCPGMGCGCACRAEASRAAGNDADPDRRPAGFADGRTGL